MIESYPTLDGEYKHYISISFFVYITAEITEIFFVELLCTRAS